MKSQISRRSHQEQRRYSGVYLQQGRMLTDADWNEQSDIVRERRREGLNDAVSSGSPRDRGLLAAPPAESGEVQLRWGRVYADGIGAEVRPSADATGRNFQYDKQLEFPDPPSDAAKKILYVDIWERHVTALEDELLRDPALFGADTATRLETIAQVKRAAREADVRQPDGAATDANPQIGDAVLNLALRKEVTLGDACDPCERELNVEQRIGNYLFRLEVHDVRGPANQPNWLVLKWSSENAGEHCALADPGTPVDFDDGKHVYEFYNEVTERHLGVHLAGAAGFPQRWDLEDDPSQPPSGARFVRRWDGFCALRRTDAGWELVEGRDGATALSDARAEGERGRYSKSDLTGGTLHVTLEKLELSLDLSGKRFLAGDYWLAVVREREELPNQVRLVPEQGTPLGIRHHYLVLGADAGGGKVHVGPGQPRRGLRFPPLSDLNAADVGYKVAQGCSWGPFDGSEDTVEKALDALCDLSAEDVAYTAGECAYLNDARTVQDALDRLCQRELAASCLETVGPDGDYETLRDALEAVRKSKSATFCLCLLPGSHPIALEEPLQGGLSSLTLRACPGAATILVQQGSWTLEGFQRVRLDGVHVKLEKQDSALSFKNCGCVTLHGVQVEGAIAAGTLVTVEGVDRFVVENSTLDAQVRKSGQILAEAFQPLFGVTNLLAMPIETDFSVALPGVASALAATGKEERASRARKIRAGIGAAGARITDNQRQRAEAVLDLLEQREVSATVLAESLIKLRSATRNQGTARALDVEDVQDRAHLEKVRISGCVRFAGCSALSLEWVETEARPGSDGLATVARCRNLDVRSCSFAHISGAGQIRVGATVATVDEKLAAPFYATTGRAFRGAMTEANDYLSAVSADQRKKVAVALRKALERDLDSLSGRDAAALNKMIVTFENPALIHLTADMIYPPARAEAEPVSAAPALALLDATGDVLLDDVTLDGELDVYGLSKGRDILEELREHPDGPVPRRSLVTNGRTLRIRHCRLERIAVGDEMISFADSLGVRPPSKLEGVYSHCVVEACQFESGGMQLVAGTLALSHNRFPGRAGPLGWVATANATVVGNLPDGAAEKEAVLYVLAVRKALGSANIIQVEGLS